MKPEEPHPWSKRKDFVLILLNLKKKLKKDKKVLDGMLQRRVELRTLWS